MESPGLPSPPALPEVQGCLVKYDSKVKATYRMCIVKKVILSEGGVVRTVKVGYRPRRLCGPDRTYKPAAFEILPVGVQRLVLICPTEELPAEASAEAPGGAPTEASTKASNSVKASEVTVSNAGIVASEATESGGSAVATESPKTATETLEATPETNVSSTKASEAVGEKL